MTDKIKLIEVDIDVEKLLKSGSNAQKTIEELQKEIKFYQNSLKEGGTLIKSYEADLARLEKQGKKNSDEYGERKKTLELLNKVHEQKSQKLQLSQSNLRKEQAQYRLTKKQIDVYNKTVEKELGIITKTDGSIDQLNQAIANNRKVYRSLNEDQRNNVEIGGKLLKLINEQDEEYKELQKSIGVTQVEVGNYKGQIKEALLESGNFSAQLDAQIAQIPILGNGLAVTVKWLRSYANGQIAAATATKGTSKTLKILRAAIISTGIGAIIVLLGSLVAYLTSTQSGINKVNKVLIPLKTVFQTIIGVIQDFGEEIFKAFEDPKKTIKELKDVFIEGLISKFNGLKKIVKGIFTFDKKAIQEGFDEATKMERQVLQKIANTGKAIAERMQEAYKRGQRIAEIQQQLSAGEADFITKVAEGKEAFKEQNKIAEDQTKTLAEREAAAQKSIEVLRETNEEQRKRNALELELLELKAASNDTSDADRAEIARKVAELKEANAALLEAETTQQNKLNTIRKEAYNKAVQLAKQRVDAEIKASQVALNRYILENDKINSTLEQRTRFYKSVLEKETALLKQQLNARKITQDEYELALLEKKKDYAQKVNEATVENLQTELDLYIAQNRSKIENETLLTDGLVSTEKRRLQEIYDQRLAILEEQRANELISEQDFLLQKLELQAGFLEQQKELETQFKTQQKEQEQLDYENELEIRRLRGESEFQLRYEELERLRLLELEQAEKRGIDVAKVESKFAERKKLLDQEVQNAKLLAYMSVFGHIKELFGEETAIGKAAAIAETTINTYKAAQAAYSAMAGIPIVGPGLGIAAAALAVAAGLKNVQKIASTKTKYAQGGSVEIGGKSHSQGGTAFYGEDGTSFEAEKGERMFILNRRASAALAPLLSDINQSYGGVALSNKTSYLATGGQVLRGANSFTQSTTMLKIDYDAMAQKIGEKVGEANLQLPNPVVAVEDINTGQVSYAQVVNGANL